MIRPLAALIAAISFTVSTLATADTLLDNIQGSTIDRNGKLAHFSALVIDAEGKIAQVLSRKDKRPKKPDYQIDGKGRFVLPGMIDAHVRLMPMALALLGPVNGASLPPPRPEDRDVAFGKVQRLLAAQGITAVADMGTSLEDWQTYRRAGDNGTLYLRIMAYAGDIPALALIAGPRPTPWLYQDRLRLNGLHLALNAPAAASLNDIQLRNLLSRAAMDGFQLAVSAPDRPEIATAMGAYAELSATYQGERRWRIEQLRAAQAADLTAFAPLSVIVTTSPSRLSRDQADATLADGAIVQPWQSLLAANLRLAFGSGDSSAAASPLAALASALSREDERGHPAGGLQPQERLSREQALAAHTIEAAYAGFAETRFGRLVEGERADFILLDRDPLLATPAELRGARVLETWIGGRKIYDAASAAQAVKGPGQSLKVPVEGTGSAPAALPQPPVSVQPPVPASPASR